MYVSDDLLLHHLWPDYRACQWYCHLVFQVAAVKYLGFQQKIFPAPDFSPENANLLSDLRKFCAKALRFLFWPLPLFQADGAPISSNPSATADAQKPQSDTTRLL
ncbi:MAG: hypothetical protein B7X10_03980 [Burkholderiales bacterium 21-58-4]|nr:MAG: hypothetical protein B7X10_03980 [Burkholderiales bacterium 21-58-4]